MIFVNQGLPVWSTLLTEGRSWPSFVTWSCFCPLGPHHKEIIRAPPSFTSHSLSAFQQRECLSCLCKSLYDYPLKAAVVDGRGKKNQVVLRPPQTQAQPPSSSLRSLIALASKVWKNYSPSDSSQVRRGPHPPWWHLQSCVSRRPESEWKQSGFRGRHWPMASPRPTLGFLLLTPGFFI